MIRNPILKASLPLLVSVSVLASALVSVKSAQALPIFSENRAIRLEGNVVLYPDSENPALVYTFPGGGELNKDEKGVPRFGMSYWGLRKNATTGEITILPDSGAYLSLSAQLTLTAAQKAEVAARLGAGGQVALLPVQESTIELSSSAPTPLGIFYSEFNMARKGGQADANIGLNAVLTGKGARTMVAQMKTNEFFKFDYCYRTLGLSPLFKGVIRLNWKQVHDVFRASFSTGGFFSRKEVQVAVERLIRDGSLDIQIDAAPNAEATYEEFLTKVADMMINRMFTTEVAPPALGGNGPLSWSFSKVSFGYSRSEVSENITIQLSRREQVVHEQCIPVSVSGLDQYPNLVRTSDGLSI